MDSKTTVELQNIVDLKDESIAELNTLHAKAVAVIDNTQVVAAANNAKTEVQAHINTEYTSCGDKRTEVRNNMTAHILNTEEVYNMNISKEIVKLPDEKDTQEANIINKIKSTPVSKIARDATMVGDVDINNVGLKKYVSGYKFPYKPNLYLNGGLVDNIHGITPRGYDSIKFREDGVFDNADSILTGQIVEGEYIWLGRETENLGSLVKHGSVKIPYISGPIIEYYHLNAGDTYSGKFYISSWKIKKNMDATISFACKLYNEHSIHIPVLSDSIRIYGHWQGLYQNNVSTCGEYNIVSVSSSGSSYTHGQDYVGFGLSGITFNEYTLIMRDFQIELGVIQTPWVSYGQSRKPTNIMYDNIQSSQNIIYMEIFGKPKIQEDQITLVEGKDYDILVKKEISNLFIENQNNIILVNRKTNKIYLNGEIVNADLYIIINQEMVMKIEYDNYFMERSIIDLYRNIKPIGYDTLVWDKGYYKSTGTDMFTDRCSGYIDKNGIFAGYINKNMFNTVDCIVYSSTSVPNISSEDGGIFTITKLASENLNVAYGLKDLKPDTDYTIQVQLLDTNIENLSNTAAVVKLHSDSFEGGRDIVLTTSGVTETHRTKATIGGSNKFGVYVRIGEPCPANSFVKIKIKVEEGNICTPITTLHKDSLTCNLFNLDILDRSKINALYIEMDKSDVDRYAFMGFNNKEYLGINYKTNATKNKWLILFKPDRTGFTFNNGTQYGLFYVNTGAVANVMSILHRQDSTSSTAWGYSPRTYVKKYTLFTNIDLELWTDEFCKKLTR